MIETALMSEATEFCRECGKVYTHRRGCSEYEPSEMEKARLDREKAELEAILKEESIAALQWAENTIRGLKAGGRQLVGASLSSTYRGGYWKQELDFDTASLRKRLASGWSPVFSDQVVTEGRNHGSGSTVSYYVGATEICSRRGEWEWNTAAEYFHSSPGGRLCESDFDALVTLLKEEFPEKETSEGEKAEVKTLRRQGRIAEILHKMEEVTSDTVGLGHIYGGSYFGSGGAWGGVRTYDLAALREGQFVEVETLPVEHGDNGFVSGVTAVKIKPGTVVVARGGDNVGYEGRKWESISFRNFDEVSK